jgi:hypothetical protein
MGIAENKQVVLDVYAAGARGGMDTALIDSVFGVA